ncbi:MAG: hypothetical protein M1436_02245 [Acidobacteria bacterium]|nr:hypothetical protein [Acidobacteriota bacterium]
MLAAIRTLAHVTELLEKQETTLAALRELLCQARTEKTAKVRVRHLHLARPAIGRLAIAPVPEIKRQQVIVFGNGFQDCVTVFLGEGVNWFNWFFLHFGRLQLRCRVLWNPFHVVAEFEELLEPFALDLEGVPLTLFSVDCPILRFPSRSRNPSMHCCTVLGGSAGFVSPLTTI